MSITARFWAATARMIRCHDRLATSGMCADEIKTASADVYALYEAADPERSPAEGDLIAFDRAVAGYESFVASWTAPATSTVVH